MPTATADLFDTPILPGLTFRRSFLTAEEETALIAAIDSQPLSPFRFQGWLGKRLTASFGWTYDFDRGSLARGAPIPDWLMPIKRRAAAFAALDVDAIVQALLIRYDPGAGIGWHRDRPAFEHVIGISLGAPATLRFRRRRSDGFDRASAPLPPRSIYHLTGEARHDWEHSIAAMDETRWSITFRSMTGKARARYGSPG
jgi:alkylated DNA repair dioxygenase AlkB